MNESSQDARALAIMVRGAYDLQKVRINVGNRLIINFRAKLKMPGFVSNPDATSEPMSDSNPASPSAPGQHRKPDPTSAPVASSNPASPSAPIKHSKPKGESAPETTSNPEQSSEPEDSSNPQATSDELSAEAEKILDQLRASYKNLMQGVARNRTLPAEKGFKGDPLISSFTELVLVDQFVSLEAQESKQFRMLDKQLALFPIYREFLSVRPDQLGIGPTIAGVLIAWFDPHKARHISSFWKFAGLDVAEDGYGRSRRAEHLIERAYVNKDGEESTRQSITYDPFVKTKLMGVVASSFIRTGSPWRKLYDDYKHRLETDPHRVRVELAEYKRRRKAGEDVRGLWTPGHIDVAAKRYMVKQFLAALWVRWRTLEGLPVTQPYAVAKQGRRPHAA